VLISIRISVMLLIAACTIISFSISPYRINTVEASSIIDKNSTLNGGGDVNSIVPNSDENATATTGNMSIPLILKDAIIKKLRTDLEWDLFNVYCEKGFYTISYLKKNDTVSSTTNTHEVFAISTDIICVKDLPYITGNEIFKRIPLSSYASSNVQSYSQQTSIMLYSNSSSSVPWWCFWCKYEPPLSTNNTKDNAIQHDNMKNTILQNTSDQQNTTKQGINVDVNNTIQFSGVLNTYNNSTMSSSGAIKLSDGTVMSSSGAIKLSDGSIKLIDGRIILLDGGIKLPDGTIKRPDGTIILPDGMPVFSNIFSMTQESKNSTNHY
jgi:hypothetical protein